MIRVLEGQLVFNCVCVLICCRCFGMLLSPGKDLAHSQMNLLDNMVVLLYIHIRLCVCTSNLNSWPCVYQRFLTYCRVCACLESTRRSHCVCE